MNFYMKYKSDFAHYPVYDQYFKKAFQKKKQQRNKIKLYHAP